MDIQGEFRIQAPREAVWTALNDPEMLKRCIPGCESIEKQSDTEFVAKMRARIGPVKAGFTSEIKLINLNPPSSYTLVGEGKGGAAGFGKGSADVELSEEGDETVLRYNASLQVGGKLAQIGSRLVGGTARKIADDFFSNFSEQMNPPQADTGAPA
ncbi:MAG: carbon monoxide dehydrogenase subunit G [Gammaproteobacteria bacterium]|nr:carbon monoxide dehydrogenase subunit G [Gammaproteobacteria bacterium]